MSIKEEHLLRTIERDLGMTEKEREARDRALSFQWESTEYVRCDCGTEFGLRTYGNARQREALNACPSCERAGS